MKLSTIAISLGLVTSLATMAGQAAAAESSLTGWGKAFAAASGQATGNNASATGSGSADASAAANFSMPEQASGEAFTSKLDEAYAKAGTALDGAAEKGNETLANVSDKLSEDVSVAYAGDTNQSLAIGDVASANIAGSLALSGTISNSAQISAIAAQTATLVSSVIASRPASLTGLLR